MNWVNVAETTLIIAVGVIATGALIYYFIKHKSGAQGGDSSPMPVVARRILVSYLVILGLVLFYAIATVISADFPEAGLAAEVVKQTSKPATPAPDVPILESVFPQSNLGKPSVVDFTLIGQNFTGDCKVRFNQQEKSAALVGSQRLQTQLEQMNIVGFETIAVDVVNTEKKTTSNSIVVIIRKARAEVSFFGCKMWMSRDLQLVMLALLAGALGSFVHVLKSFGDFVGNRTLTASWFWWYMTRPFLGAALAVTFYAVLRGGFMAGSQADAKAVNQFGVVAVGALVGMFADKASDKLADIFDTLFKGADDRGGKLAAPIIDSLDPETIAHGSAPQDLKLIGDRLGKVTQVKFDNVVHPHEAVADKLITVPLTAADLATARTIKISVVGSNGESPTKDFQIT